MTADNFGPGPVYQGDLTGAAQTQAVTTFRPSACTGGCMKAGGICACFDYPCPPSSTGYYTLPLGHPVIGTCSLCGGAVTVPTLWGGIIPPTPTCSSCGAVKKAAHGPVVEMERRA